MTRAQNRYHDWSCNNAPNDILHSVNANDQFGDGILRTSVALTSLCE